MGEQTIHKIKFLVDESSGGKLYNFLLLKGFDAKFVSGFMPRASDSDVLDFAEKEERILITNDKDFGELVFRFNKPATGVILLRLSLDTPKNRQTYLDSLLNNFSDKLESNFCVVTESHVRVRKIR